MGRFTNYKSENLEDDLKLNQALLEDVTAQYVYESRRARDLEIENARLKQIITDHDYKDKLK
jgi:hypothetical protein